MALIWAGPLDAPGVLVNVVLTIYLIVGTLLEERKLVVQFGAAYREYQERVSMLFPFKWIAGGSPFRRRDQAGGGPATQGASMQAE